MGTRMNRRQALREMAGALAVIAMPQSLAARGEGPRRKAIPSTGEMLPVVGMGTWRTFNVGDDRTLRDARTEVLRAFFAAGGGMIDTSPMYGSSQAVLGYGLQKLGFPGALLSADKVWTSRGDRTASSVQSSEELWRVKRVDLMQVHNLLAWEDHLPALQKMKAAGRIRYVGITTSHGRRHRDLESVLKSERLDFVQLTYNIAVREVEERLLPLAKDRGIAVIANRPFGGGGLIARFEKHPLPSWAAEIGCANWPQFLLAFVVSHPAITCAIPATSRVEHMRENMGAARGPLPDAATRKRMLAYVASL